MQSENFGKAEDIEENQRGGKKEEIKETNKEK